MTKKEKETFKTRFYFLIHHTAMTIPLKHTYMQATTEEPEVFTIDLTILKNARSEMKTTKEVQQ